MLEENDLVCPSCEKIIRYERPNFCPFCGCGIDPSVGLAEGSHLDLYPASRIAPTMMYVFFGWIGVGLPVTFFFGKTGFVIVSCIFVLMVLFLFFGSVWEQGLKKSKKDLE